VPTSGGYPGSITSIHAAITTLAFEQLVLLVKESVAGRELARTDILELLHQVIDVIVQFDLSRQCQPGHACSSHRIRLCSWPVA
jgi:type IV secretory pathway ATPase VirB11/archaellum biosynthesis ATPase